MLEDGVKVLFQKITGRFLTVKRGSEKQKTNETANMT